jgi:hypothetical protein
MILLPESSKKWEYLEPPPDDDAPVRRRRRKRADVKDAWKPPMTLEEYTTSDKEWQRTYEAKCSIRVRRPDGTMARLWDQ